MTDDDANTVVGTEVAVDREEMGQVMHVPRIHDVESPRGII